jgi:hypothetical protein
MLPVAARLREKRDEEERAAALARTRLEPETAVAAEIAGLASALEAASAGAPRTQSAAAAILHRGSLALAALGEEIEAVEGREYADLETAAELHAARELLEDALAPALAGDAAAAGPAAARARELAAALHAGAPARRVGRAIQDLDFAAGGAEDLAWKLRGIRAGSHRALHTHLRAEREVLGLAKAAREGLVEYARGAGPTAPAPGGAAWAADLERLLQPLADAEAAAREAAHALAEKAAISGPEGEAAIALAAGASGRAARALGEAVEALERFRSVSFPEAAAARARLRSELGTLPERIARLAVRERAHARRVEAAALAAAGGGTGAAGSAGGDPQILLAEHEELRAAVADLAPRLKADGDRLLAAAAPVESLRLRDRAAARLAAAAADPMAAASRALKEAAAARPDEAARGARLLEAAGREEEAASELAAGAAALAALDLDAALDAVEGELANARPESGRRPQADEPPDLARITRDARHLLAGTQRAAETLSAKAAGVPAARALEALRRAAELFRGALDAAAREDAPAAAAALRAGLERLDDAIAAVRELRGASAPELAAAREALGKGEGAEAENAAPGKSSRELEAAYDELDKILKIQTLERELAGKLEELAGKQPDPEGLREAQEKARDLAKEMDDRFLTGEELVELVAKLIAVEREGRGAAELARELAAGAARTEAGAPGGLPADELAARRGGLVDRARKSARDFQEAGFKLSGALPHVLRAYWQGLEASQEMLRAVEEAVERSAAGPGGSGRGEGTGATAPAPGAPAAPIVPSRALLAAGSKVEAFLGRVDAMRHEALQAIADLERGGDGPNAAQAGLEQARRSAREAAQLLEAGDRDAAGRAAQAGSRSLADAARAVRSRMAGTLLPGGAEGSLMSRVLDEEAARLGLAWRVLTRGQELEGAERNPATDDMPFPSEFRELVRLYMQALREGRSP